MKCVAPKKNVLCPTDKFDIILCGILQVQHSHIQIYIWRLLIIKNYQQVCITTFAFYTIKHNITRMKKYRDNIITKKIVCSAYVIYVVFCYNLYDTMTFLHTYIPHFSHTKYILNQYNTMSHTYVHSIHIYTKIQYDIILIHAYIHTYLHKKQYYTFIHTNHTSVNIHTKNILSQCAIDMFTLEWSLSEQLL